MKILSARSLKFYLAGGLLILHFVAGISAIAAADETVVREATETVMRQMLNSPEKLEFEFSGFSEDSEKFNWKKSRVVSTRATFDGLTIDHGELQFTNLSVNRDALLRDKRLVVDTSSEILLDMKISEKSLNEYVEFKRSKTKVDAPQVRLEQGLMYLSGSFHWKIGRISFQAVGRFDVRGDEIHFLPRDFKVNRMNLPPYVMRKTLKMINPVLDLKKFPFRIRVKNIFIDGGNLVITSFPAGK